jgi:hypothetical protein
MECDGSELPALDPVPIEPLGPPLGIKWDSMGKSGPSKGIGGFIAIEARISVDSSRGYGWSASQALMPVTDHR